MKHPSRTLALATSLLSWVRKERPITAPRISIGFLALGILAGSFLPILIVAGFREDRRFMVPLWAAACLVLGPSAIWFSGIGRGTVRLFKGCCVGTVVGFLAVALVVTLNAVIGRPERGMLLVMIFIFTGPACFLIGAIAGIIGIVERSGSRGLCLLCTALNVAACVADIALFIEIGKAMHAAFGGYS